jgi:hypothetical protein
MLRVLSSSNYTPGGNEIQSLISCKLYDSVRVWRVDQIMFLTFQFLKNNINWGLLAILKQLWNQIRRADAQKGNESGIRFEIQIPKYLQYPQGYVDICLLTNWYTH